MSFTVQVGPVLAARLNSMWCSYRSSQSSSRNGLSCMAAPRTRLWFPLSILPGRARMIFSLRPIGPAPAHTNGPSLRRTALEYYFPVIDLASLLLNNHRARLRVCELELEIGGLEPNHPPPGCDCNLVGGGMCLSVWRDAAASGALRQRHGKDSRPRSLPRFSLRNAVAACSLRRAAHG